MALDRTWYNTLVDDDGSNTVGSVWNKASVDALMDSVDVELDRFQGPWEAFTPPLYATAGTWSSAAARVRLQQSGRTMLLQFAIDNSSLSASTSEIHIAVPVNALASPLTPMASVPILLNGTYELGIAYIPAAGSVLTFFRLGGQAFPATTGALTVRGQFIYETAA